MRPAFLQVEPHHFSATLGALNAGDLQHWCVGSCMHARGTALGLGLHPGVAHP